MGVRKVGGEEALGPPNQVAGEWQPRNGELGFLVVLRNLRRLEIPAMGANVRDVGVAFPIGVLSLFAQVLEVGLDLASGGFAVSRNGVTPLPAAQYRLLGAADVGAVSLSSSSSQPYTSVIVEGADVLR